MSAPVPNLGTALLAALDDDTIRTLAERLRPYLETSHDDRRLLTPVEAAERLRLHPKTVVRMARDGRLPARRIGTGWRFHPDRLDIAPRSRPTIEPPRSPRRRASVEPASVRAIRGEHHDRERRAA